MKTDILTIMNQGAHVQTVALSETLVRVGRGSDCQVRICDADKQISRHHALIKRQCNHYAIRNEDSTLGTIVNGRNIGNWHPLKEGDCISIGGYHLIYSFGIDATIDPDATLIGSAIDFSETTSPTARPQARPFSTLQVQTPIEAPTVKLNFIAGPFDGGEVYLHGDRIPIGRDRQNTLWLNDPTVSGRHAEIYGCAGSWFIRDLHSFNGVWADGQIVTGKRRIKSGECIRIGDSEFVFQLPKTQPLPRDRTPRLSYVSLAIALVALGLGMASYLQPPPGVPATDPGVLIAQK